MNIEELYYFSEVSKSGSFSFTAQKLGVGEEIINLSIRRLENKLGFKLIELSSDSKVVITYEGLQVISLVNEVLMKYEEIEELVQSLNKNLLSI
ncbi:LysR family transcriptional regulator [Gottfriedia acidiceleris]|uniref:LysR family transcriptional regulator n=1 Tax=Gottfriedia acidiceleris TaxID=371036 RepID=UPI003D2510F8